MKRIPAVFLPVFILWIAVLCHAETLTLSTYYPAPFGAYDRLRLVPRAAVGDACAAGLEGMVYADNTTGIPTYCLEDPATAGSFQWEFLPGAWTQFGDNVYVSDTANANIRLGVGDNTPDAKFEAVLGTLGFMVSSTTDGDGDRFIVTNSGEVGIGTTAPGSKLSITGAGITNATSSLSIVDNGNNSLLFVRDDGRVGVGTGAPAEKFHIVGGSMAVEKTDATDSQIRFKNDTSWYAMGIDASDTNQFKINMGQNIGDNPGFTLNAGGNVTIDGTLTVKSDGTNSGPLRVQYLPGTKNGYYATYAP
jgi:hypothetical protein